MTNNAKKREVKMPGGLRQKLTAAIAMLLVSAIMLVSATYAWFTLSTAPEVKGISTSVGANGSLEMALLTKTVGDIKSGVGDSSAVQDVKLANRTWGNLVDLSDEAYGFNALTLNPARLMFNEDGTALKDANMLLGTADYGSDGRVSAISSARSMISVAGSYAGEGDLYGVRAIGDNSALSPEEVAVNKAKITFNSSLETAKSGAKSVLDMYGEQLANIAVRHGTADAGTDTYTKAEVNAIRDVITALEAEAANIETVLKAEALVRATVVDGSADHTLEEQVVTNDKLTALTTAIATAKAAIPAAEKDSYTWAEIQPALSAIIDPTGVTVNGTTISDLKDNLIGEDGQINSDYALEIATNPSVETSEGILASVAEFTGNYKSIGFSLPVTAMGMSVTLKNATLAATTTANPAVLMGIAADIVNLKYEGETSSDNAVISDNYGYAVDLAFRSNTNTNLQLQTDGVQRIYNDATVVNPDTQGGGSKMTFTSTVLTEAQMKALMGAIRVVFTVPGGTEVYGVATLDLAAPAEGTEPTYSFTTTGSTVTGTANLVMSKYTVDADGKIVVAGKADNDTITTLNQGEAKGVTAIVYLDGDIVDNSMVANASNSMAGSLNLQFSSSEQLTPMNYTPLKK